MAISRPRASLAAVHTWLLSIEQSIVLEFHSLQTLRIEAYETDQMSGQLGIGIEPPVLFQERDAGQLKGLDLVRLLSGRFFFEPIQRVDGSSISALNSSRSI